MAKSGACSEIVMVPDERVLAVHAAQAVREMPSIANMNVTNSSKIHVGPKFVSVNQTVQNKEMIKGQILGLELVSAESSRRLRCSVAVFLCWALLVSLCLAFYLFYITIFKQQVRLDIGLNETWYLRREEWQAMKKYEEEFLELPVNYAIIGHSAGKYCKNKYECIESVLGIQRDYLQKGYSDIGPNFLVGGEGYVFEGRGANIIGAMVKTWNLKSITIMFMGDYRKNKTEPAQIEHVNVLLEKLVEKNVLVPHYVLYGHCQVATQIISPGPNIMSQMKKIRNWDNINENTCLKD